MSIHIHIHIHIQPRNPPPVACNSNPHPGPDACRSPATSADGPKPMVDVISTRSGSAKSPWERSMCVAGDTSVPGGLMSGLAGEHLRSGFGVGGSDEQSLG